MGTDTSEKLEQAGEVLFDHLYVPAFIKQCAARGVEIQTPDDLLEALDNVNRIKQAEVQLTSDDGDGSIHKQASAALSSLFGEEPSGDDAAFHKFASEVTPTPEALAAAKLVAGLLQEE
ncbi:MAG: hypothetical protein DRP45_11455 [Candidatus Zixiibacteriota bacterium]|nr:MAG: hypothetical protein DRP45_11455 [candidate division Zixibacteria bacterium]